MGKSLIASNAVRFLDERNVINGGILVFNAQGMSRVEDLSYKMILQLSDTLGIQAFVNFRNDVKNGKQIFN